MRILWIALLLALAYALASLSTPTTPAACWTHYTTEQQAIEHCEATWQTGTTPKNGAKLEQSPNNTSTRYAHTVVKNSSAQTGPSTTSTQQAPTANQTTTSPTCNHYAANATDARAIASPPESPGSTTSGHTSR